MHPVIRTQRRSAAINRIVERATVLVQHLELDPQLAEGLHPPSLRDPGVAELQRLEALAAVLDQVTENVGAPAPAVTDVTVNEFIAPAAPAEGGPVQVEETFIPAGAVPPDEIEVQAQVKESKRTSRTSKKK